MLNTKTSETGTRTFDVALFSRDEVSKLYFVQYDTEPFALKQSRRNMYIARL